VVDVTCRVQANALIDRQLPCGQPSGNNPLAKTRQSSGLPVTRPYNEAALLSWCNGDGVLAWTWN